MLDTLVQASSEASDGLRSTEAERRHPLLELEDQDLEFVLRLVLASGSLKELARAYGVSYPTIRARLDRLIARLERMLENRPVDPIAELLGDLVQRGEITVSGARAIQELHRNELLRRREED